MFTINIKFVLKDLQSQHLTKKLWLACGDCRNHLQGFKTCCRHFIDFIFANKTWFTQIIIVIIRYQKHAAAISWNTFGCSAVRFMAPIAQKDPFWGQNAVFFCLKCIAWYLTVLYGARAVSRKTPIYFTYLQIKWEFWKYGVCGVAWELEWLKTF